MFVLDPQPTFRHKITSRVPVDGGFKDQKFWVTYRVLSDEELAKFDVSEPMSAVSFLKSAVVDLDDIQGKDGNPLPYSDDLRDQLIGFPFVRNPMVRGYFDAVYQARVGN